MSVFDLFKKKTAGDVAKDRLKFLLVSDRAKCSPEVMEMLKRDIISCISKYMEIDYDGLDIQITTAGQNGEEGNAPALFANIPIKEVKHNV